MLLVYPNLSLSSFIPSPSLHFPPNPSSTSHFIFLLTLLTTVSISSSHSLLTTMGFSTRTISQEAFDPLVAENISDLSMDPEKALEDTVQTLTLHSVNLFGIVKCFPGVNCLEDNPVMRSLDGLKKVSARLEYSETESSDLDEVVYGYARRFSKIGIVDALMDAFHEGIGSSCLVSTCIVLKAIVVNDEICRSISSKGGIDEILQCIDDGSVYNNKDVAKTYCSL